MVTLLNCDYFGFIENGEFLSLDLGGSKFRVLKVQVSQEGKQNVQMESQFYPTPNEIIRGNGTEVPTGGRAWVLAARGSAARDFALSLVPAFSPAALWLRS